MKLSSISNADTVFQVAKSIGSRIQLLKKENSDKVIPPEAVFASVSLYSLVSSDGNVVTGGPGGGNNSKLKFSEPTDGYLFHDGQTLTFADLDKVHFKAALQDIKVEDHKLGVLITFNNGTQIMIGKSIPLADPKFKKNISGSSWGEEGHWKKEFVRLGKIDREAYEKANKGNKFMLFFILAIVIVTFLAAILL